MGEVKTPEPSRRSERSHQAILTAAVELVGEVGYARLTIEAIAARAGVGKQTIYRWWPSKGAVVLDAFVSLSGGNEPAALPDTGDLEADLKMVLRATVEELTDPRFELPSRALTAESQSDPALSQQFVEAVLRPHLTAIQERLRAAQRAGQVAKGVDLSVAVELIVGPLFHRWLLRTAPLTKAYADTVAELAVAALRPASRKPRG
ncbi:TetR/AcrR family transcriptional regulator [Corallococcus praedator]|uniref:TetR/AcrR family transcriptional regulator n=1 Tax=Corallococcus praedator TaxID=2316724 RepID=A0ABX9QEV3_9BACT|nr:MULTISPECIES: TetR/AcrR family transcriptional regulator [Corallococcus]RKH13492.1 TetR/AcrR family transcriptional regulator [Corallococcus sp. CA047B]RKH28317.1 TetR/AcrR family transcriptional regulator [Corallococcus sp. CA031C]RKI06052.1 TetR/AcrR family transcriptional regulator [Corallococcus praedator]